MNPLASPQIGYTAWSAPLGDYLAGFSDLYPEIKSWFDKVQGDVLQGTRSIYLVSDGLAVRGAAISKHGAVGKLCHLSVDQNFRGFGFARRLAALAVQDLYTNGSKDVIVTTSESTFHTYGSFFDWLGFSTSDWHRDRYRIGVTEIIWAARIEELVDRVHNRTNLLSSRIPPTFIEPGVRSSYVANCTLIG